jgi:hypothetical protein
MAAFEKAAGVRFGVAADKPKLYNTYFDELKAEAGLSISFNLIIYGIFYC